MTPSKEDILDKYAIGEDVFIGSMNERLFRYEDAKQAIDEYAKEIAIGFLKFIENGYHPFMASDKYMRHASLEPGIPWPDLETVELFTTEQLFQSYIKTLQLLER